MLTTSNIYQACRGYFDSSSSCILYFLVDHAGLPGLTKILDKSQTNWVSLFSGSKEEKAISVAPLLFQVEFDAEQLVDNFLVNWIFINGTYNSSVIFLATPLTLLELAERLKRRLNATLPDKMDVLLRFYDPRIFESLCKILPVEKKREFLNAACCWWHIDRKGKVCETKSEFLTVDSFESPMILDIKQQNFLIDSSTVDQVNDLLTKLAKNYYFLLSPLERYEFLEKSLAEAGLKGIESVYELSLHCVKILVKNNSKTFGGTHVE